MTSLFVRPGDQLIRAGSSDPLVRAHAARRPNGDLAVLLVNQDPTNARPVSLRYAGYSPTSTAQVYTFADGATAITSTSGPASTVTLPPYSLTTLVLHPSGPVAGPAAPGQPTASAVTATSATIAWPAGPGGVKYELHRQNGTTSEQWGETTGTSFTVYNLVPGTRYTANVIARDGAGRVSWASPPITFQTGTPSTSECAVTFTNTTDWGNGYVASVDITNTSANPVDSWTLSFTWPTNWQQMSGGWNGNWSETGSTVRVSNVDWNRTIAAGATANVGFVGAYQGPNVQPPVFTLNGKLCTTR
jgi:cellulase/cellobiase CelA1